MTEVYDRCYNIHAMTERAESYIEWQVDKLRLLNDKGWWGATTPMTQLRNDAKALRALARKLDDIYDKMTTEAA